MDPPGYHYKSNKESLNNNVDSTIVDTLVDSLQDSQQSMAVIQDQYNHIIHLFQNVSSYSPAMFEVALPNINLVSTSIDGKPPIYWVIDTGSTHHMT